MYLKENQTNKVEEVNNQKTESKLTLTKGKIVIEADKFEVYDRAQRLMFGINKIEDNKHLLKNSTNNNNNKITIRADHLNLLGVCEIK